MGSGKEGVEYGGLGWKGAGRVLGAGLSRGWGIVGSEKTGKGA